MLSKYSGIFKNAKIATFPRFQNINFARKAELEQLTIVRIMNINSL